MDWSEIAAVTAGITALALLTLGGTKRWLARCRWEANERERERLRRFGS